MHPLKTILKINIMRQLEVKLPKSQGGFKANGKNNKYPRYFQLNEIDGYYTHCGYIFDGSGYKPSNDTRDVFKTKKQAESALAMAQISQLLPIYNEGWEPDWGDTRENKYCFYRHMNEVRLDVFYKSYSFIAFKSYEIAEAFLENERDLIEKYFML